MAGIFDEDVYGKPVSEPPPSAPDAAPAPTFDPTLRRVIIATPPTPAAQGNVFDEDLHSTPPPAPVARNETNWARFNQPFGELKQADPSFTEQVIHGGQDTLGAVSRALGGTPDPYNTRRIAEKVVGLAGFTPAGAVLSAGDAGYNLSRGKYGKAALDALGIIPGAMQARRAVQWARGELPMLRTAATPTRTVDEATGRVADELLNSARGHYDAVARAPIAFTPGTMPNFTDAARTALQQPQYGAFTPEASRGVHDLLARWGADFGPNRVATPHDFDVLRQQLRAFGEGPDSAAGQRAAGFVDRFLSNPPSPSVLRAAPGALDTVRRDLAAARGDYRAGKTAETVNYAIDRAGTKAGGANSGLNTDNTTRQAILGLANPPVGGYDKIFGATYPERQALNAVGAGDWATNKARYLSNRMGGGGGFVGSFGGGIAGHTVNSLLGSWGVDPITATATGMAAGYAWPKVGEAFRGIANERTVRAAENAVEQIRRNSPLYRARAAASPDIPDPFALQRDAIAYAMIPQIKQKATELWDRSHVPYANRGQ